MESNADFLEQSVEVLATPQAESSKSTHGASVTPLFIQPSSGWGSLNLRELWEHRELVYFFTWRDIKVHYRQTVLGAGWAVLQPILTMVVFSLFFGRLAKVPSDGVPYALFSYVALVPWMFFVNGVTHASNSLVMNQNVLTKVYFPRMALPLSTVLAGVVDFAIAFVVLVGMIGYYRITPTLQVLYLPLLFILAVVTSLGVSLWLSALNVRFRDVRFTVPFLTQFWMFATPVAYSSSLLPAPWRTVFGINPMVGVVEGFRWALLGVDTTPGPTIAVSSAVAIALLVSGAFYFRRLERTFADVV